MISLVRHILSHADEKLSGEHEKLFLFFFRVLVDTKPKSNVVILYAFSR